MGCRIIDEETPPHTPIKKNQTKDYSSDINNDVSSTCKRKLYRDFNLNNQENESRHKRENELLWYRKYFGIQNYTEESIILIILLWTLYHHYGFWIVER